ncbi:MAG: HAMP domain-containing sensor histidine kinase [Ilumatobacteraceae bacterium]
MSLRWRIALALGAIAAATTIAVGVIGYRTTRDRLYAEIDQSLTDSIALLGAGRGLERPGAWDRLPERGPLSVYDVQLLDADGEVYASTFEGGFDPTVGQAALVGATRLTEVRNVTIEDAEYRVRTVGLPNGALQVARPLAETNRVLDSLRARTLILVFAVTAAGAAAGFLIAGRVTASLRRLTAAAETVESTGQLDVDVPSTGSDEAGRLGAAFQRMLGALARSRSDQQRLVQDAGHELRTPLTSLRTNLDVLRRYPDLAVDQRRQIIDDLHTETEELVHLVDEVVAVASGASDDDPFEPLSLGDVTHELATRYERRSGREVRVEVDESPVDAQLGAIQRAVSNLLDNARKFDASGGPIDVRVSNGTVEVSDRGPGIPDGEQALVFERFHRAAESRTLPGSGLGLSIVREVVERHHGSVRVAARVGGGAVVGFTLPLRRPPAAQPDLDGV